MIRLVSSRSYFVLVPLALVSISTLTNADTAASPVWVVTDRWHPVHGEAVRVIELDATARIEAELSKRLSKNPLEAQAHVRLQDDVIQAVGRVDQWRRAQP